MGHCYQLYELLPLAVDVCGSYDMFMSVLHLLRAVTLVTACNHNPEQSEIPWCCTRFIQ